MSIAEDVLAHFEAAPSAPRPQRDDPFAVWRQELATYALEMKDLRSQPADTAMAWISSVSARALEMQLYTLDNDTRVATKFRVEVVLPFKKECEFQFQIASRRQAVNEMEWKITRGYES